MGFATSCSSTDVYDPSHTTGTHTTSLKVPADFDWATTRGISCDLTSPVQTVVSIYNGKECRDNQLVSTLSLAANKTTQAQLELPAGSTAFYVQYPTANGKKVWEQKVNVATRADANMTLPEDCIAWEPDPGCYGDCISYMPAKGVYGTLMFEDQFPQLGDYDMNDFVAGYYIEGVASVGNKSTYLEGTDIYLQIRAIGGSYPYRLCVELPLLASDVADSQGTFYSVSSTNSRITAELLTSGNQKAIFAINGTSSLKEGSFFNTEEASGQAIPTVHIAIQRDNFDDTKAFRFMHLLNSESYNFFLQNSSTRQEIHLKGYATTALASNPGATFASSNNLVWGIKVPALIAHPKEKIDMTEAYPKFAGWVTSGGTKNEDWYQTNVSDKVIK